MYAFVWRLKTDEDAGMFPTCAKILCTAAAEAEDWAFVTTSETTVSVDADAVIF